MDKTALSMEYKNTFAGEHGQVVLEDLDRVCKWNVPDMCFEPENDRATSFNLGKLSVIRYIHGMIDKKLNEVQEKAIHKEIING